MYVESKPKFRKPPSCLVANLNTYITSYLRANGSDVTYADWVYVSTTKTVVMGLLMSFTGEFSRRIGTWKSIALGTAIYR